MTIKQATKKTPIKRKAWENLHKVDTLKKKRPPTFQVACVFNLLKKPVKYRPENLRYANLKHGVIILLL